MDELQRRKKLKGLLYSIPSLCVLVVLTILLARGAIGVMNKERESAHRITELEAKAEALGARQSSIEEGIERLKTTDGIVEEIKSKFSVEREGEHVAVVVDERVPASTTDATEEGVSLKNVWGRIKNLWSDPDSSYNTTQ